MEWVDVMFMGKLDGVGLWVSGTNNNGTMHRTTPSQFATHSSTSCFDMFLGIVPVS